MSLYWQACIDFNVSGVLSGAGDALLYALASFGRSLYSPFRLNALEYTGSVGEIVAAALETKGLIDQGKILENSELLKTIAALGWIFSIAMAIGSVAVFGGYKQALYLLVGPAFFLFMITETTTTDGTKMRVGDRDYPNSKADQNEFLHYIHAITNADGSTGSANISLFFAIWDSMVSEGVQKVVSVILDTKNRADLRFKARERMLSYVLMKVPQEAGLLKLMIAGTFGQCAEATGDYMIAGQSKHKNTPVKLRDTTDVSHATDRADELWEFPSTVHLDMQMKRWLFAKKGLSGFENVWWDESSIAREINVSCKQTWAWMYSGLSAIAEQLKQAKDYQGMSPDKSDIPWTDVEKDVEKFLQGKSNDVTAIISAFLLKNTINLSAHSALQSTLYAQSPFNKEKNKAIFGLLQRAEAHGGYFQMQYFSRAIPYVQGLMLYLLAVAFPFFAIFLVLPGRATTFFVWCSLWVWVKSWDIGFALVHVAREILWQTMKHRVDTFEQKLDWTDPTSVFAVIFNNDPLNTQNTYWEMTSILTCAVPLVTAYFCLGATDFFDMFVHSLDQTAARFGAQETAASLRHVGNEVEHEMRLQEAKMQLGYADAAHTNPQATTITGVPLAREGFMGTMDSGAANLRPSETAAAARLSAYLLQVATPDYLDRIGQTTKDFDDLERDVNYSRKTEGGKDVYTPRFTSNRTMPLPRSFLMTMAASGNGLGGVLNHKLGAEAMKEVYGNKAGEKGERTWAQAIQDWAERPEHAGTKLTIAHAFRGMPSLDSNVVLHGNPETGRSLLKALYGDQAKDKEGMTWRDLYLEQGQIQRGHGAILAQLTERNQFVRIKAAAEGMADFAAIRQMNASMGAQATDQSSINQVPGLTDFLGVLIQRADEDSVYKKGRKWEPE